MLRFLNEKELFYLSFLPPFLLTVVTVYLLNLSPKEMLHAVVPLVQGLKWKNEDAKDDSVAVFQLDKSADLARQVEDLHHEQLRQVTDLHRQVAGLHHRQVGDLHRRVAAAAKAAATAAAPGHLLLNNFPRYPKRPEVPIPLESLDDTELSDNEEEASQEARESPRPGAARPRQWSQETPREEEGRQIIVNIRHLAWTSAIPIGLVWLYFWDETMLRREASNDFPLRHCMDVKRTSCFYIEQEYSVSRWPEYKRLACEEMRQKTVESPDGFYFQEPEEAKFYKCYTWNLRLRNFITASGDVVGLLAIFVLIIFYSNVYLVDKVDEDMTIADRKDQAKGILRQKRNFSLYQVALVVLIVVEALILEHVYGRKTSDLMALFGPPGVCIFGIITLQCRKELLAKAQELEVWGNLGDSPLAGCMQALTPCCA